MKILDVEQRLSFLDEEHRRERAAIEQLRSAAATQAAEMAQLNERFTELMADFTRTQTRLGQLTTLEHALGHMRAELVRMLDEQKAHQASETERLRAQDAAGLDRAEALAKSVQALQEGTVKTTRALVDLRREDETHVGTVAELAKRVQRIGEVADNALRQSQALSQADRSQMDRTAEVAEEVQALRERVEGQAGEIQRGLTRLDAQGEEMANLYRLAQDVEERLTGAQALAAEVRERIARQSEAMVEMGRSMQALRADLTTTQGALVKFPQIEKALQIAKDELTLQIQTYREQHQAQYERIVQEKLSDRQETARGLAELNQRLEVLPGIHERLDRGERETGRINQSHARLEARVEQVAHDLSERLDPMPFLDEQLQKHDLRIGLMERDVAEVDKKIDAKTETIPVLHQHLSQVTKRVDYVEAALPTHTQDIEAIQTRLKFWGQHSDRHADRLDLIEADLTKLHRADAAVAEKVEFLEDWVQRSATRLDELQRFEDELRKTLAEMVEAEKVRDAHRDQRMSTWSGELEDHRKEVEAWKVVLRRYEEHHQGVTRQMTEMRDLGLQLDHAQRASTEAQRIEAEKVRREVNEWQQDVDKRWALFFKQRDWDWGQQKEVNATHAGRLAELQNWRSADVQSMAELAQRLDLKDRELLMRLEDLWEIEETALRRRMAELKTWLAEVEETKAKSPKPRVPKPGEKVDGRDPRYRNG